jgi:putative membrane protein
MPRGYGFFVTRLLFLFALLFPFTVVDAVGWVVVPLNLIVCLGFTLISEIGRILEDPFNHFFNSLPITNLSVTIERNLRQRLGDADLPDAVAVDAHGVLW